ncbi:MAG: hypothetical protein ABSH48_06795 [Verrucomicrobiota bacterium]
MKATLPLLLAAMAGCAQNNAAGPAGGVAPSATSPARESAAPANAAAVKAEQLRMDCIAGRRLICGKVLRVLPDGLVVESGYTDLLRPPLTKSWVVPATASAHRNPTAIELREPGTPCLGLAFLTDTPRRPKAKLFDYVIIMGYPAGSYDYLAAPKVRKTIRKFSAGLDTAVRLLLQAQDSRPGAAPAHDSH